MTSCQKHVYKPLTSKEKSMTIFVSYCTLTLHPDPVHCTCKANLTITAKSLILARENQRENSKVSVARAGTIYKLVQCDKVEWHGPHAEVSMWKQGANLTSRVSLSEDVLRSPEVIIWHFSKLNISDVCWHGLIEHVKCRDAARLGSMSLFSSDVAGI
jgi:hypothetical protein